MKYANSKEGRYTEEFMQLSDRKKIIKIAEDIVYLTDDRTGNKQTYRTIQSKADQIKILTNNNMVGLDELNEILKGD